MENKGGELLQFLSGSLQKRCDHIEEKMLTETNKEQCEAYMVLYYELYPILVLTKKFLLEGINGEYQSKQSTGDHVVSGKQESTKAVDKE